MNLRERINARRENSYLEYVNLCRDEGCLGEDAKMRTAGFGRRELEAHKEASRKLGQHIAFAEVLRIIDECSEP